MVKSKCSSLPTTLLLIYYIIFKYTELQLAVGKVTDDLLKTLWLQRLSSQASVIQIVSASND